MNGLNIIKLLVFNRILDYDVIESIDLIISLIELLSYINECLIRFMNGQFFP